MKKPNEDWAEAHHINSFSTAELVFPKASVIGLLLYDNTANPGEAAHRDQPFLFRMTPDRARAIAQALIECADEIDGTHRARQ